MPGKVILTVTRGEKQGTSLEVTEYSRVLIGRREDCAIIMPEKSVSRCHCLLEINPPLVRLQDFGSLNGTFLNGKLIGSRPSETPNSPDSSRNDSIVLKDGDRLGLGSVCEITCHIVAPDPISVSDTVPDPEPEPAVKPEPESAADPEPDLPADGSLLKSLNRIRCLGRGGMGEVWQVRYPVTGREYALKTLLPDVEMDDSTRRVFLREASIALSLRHPNVVRTYRTGCEDGTLYILMDLCRGGSIDALVRERGHGLGLVFSTWVILQVLSGLDYVHRTEIRTEVHPDGLSDSRVASVRGIVHRDFKPGNVFLSDSGNRPQAMVADFGMAKAFSIAGQSNISKSGSLMGTPVFMPRQQVRDCKYATPEVDVWAAAATYYYMLTGRYVRDFRDERNVWMVLLTEKPIPVRDREPAMPEKLAEVIDRALREEPALFYSSADDFRRDIIETLPDDVRSCCREIL